MAPRTPRFHRHGLSLVLELALLLPASLGTAADRRAAPADVAVAIDRLVDTRLTKEKIPAAPQADDAEFLRRVHLDLVGRIPSPERAVDFLDSKAPEKRARLIDELLASADYGRHFANVWYDLIVPRTPLNARINPEALRRAFVACFNDNVPWSEVAARVALCQDGTTDQNFLAFYQINGDMGGNPMANVVARSYARLFLGVKLECAECHDDPVKPWKQEDYWGLSAFFGRVTKSRDRSRENFAIEEGTGYKTPKGNNFRLTVKPDGSLTIHHEAWKNAGQAIKPQVLGGKPVAVAALQPLLPSLAAWIRAADNPYLARAAVNRFWAHLFARGLAQPLDDFHSDAEVAHPELLALLTQEFTRAGHDLKHFFRCVCNSKTYQRSSKKTPGDSRGADAFFGRMAIKSLTAETLLAALGVAYDNPELFPRTAPAKGKKGARVPVFTRKHFIDLFNTNDVEGDATDFTHGIPQVLHLMNLPLYNAGGNAVERVLKTHPDPGAAVERLYLATLSRRPNEAERQRKLQLVRGEDSLREGLNAVLWTLINQTEFQVNR